MTRREVTEDPELALVLGWMRRELTVPHPEMGRPTAVCPFMSRALATNAVWMAKVPEVHESSDVERSVMLSLAEFERLPPIADEQLKAMVLVFPSISTADDAVAMIDEVQYALKPSLVEAGFMIGELHPWNQTPPRANPGSSYRPNRSPVPAIALRRLHPHDVGFLIGDADEVRARRMLVSYLGHVEWRRIPERAQHELTARLGEWLLRPAG